MWSRQGFISSDLVNNENYFSHKNVKWTTKKKEKTVSVRKAPLGYVSMHLETPTRFIVHNSDDSSSLPEPENTNLAPNIKEFDANNFQRYSLDVFKLLFRALMIFPACFKFNTKDS